MPAAQLRQSPFQTRLGATTKTASLFEWKTFAKWPTAPGVAFPHLIAARATLTACLCESKGIASGSHHKLCQLLAGHLDHPAQQPAAVVAGSSPLMIHSQLPMHPTGCFFVLHTQGALAPPGDMASEKTELF